MSMKKIFILFLIMILIGEVRISGLPQEENEGYKAMIKFINEDGETVYHPHPYLFNFDSLDSNYANVVRELRCRIPPDLRREFKSKSMVIVVGLSPRSKVDTVYVLISSGSEDIDSIVIRTVYNCKFYYPLLKRSKDRVYMSIPILREDIICRRKRFWDFLKFFK
ncbi:MAG: energy transducer TonB [Candidatus Marinimicrobia bacterium]|nr:energy transducer TonB [Candidatus Neomarinimicrobiota bacterium]